MTFLEASLGALGRSQPLVADVVRRTAASPRGEWSLAKTGAPVARVAGTSLASAFDPQTEADRAVPGCEDADFVLLPGLGLGYLAEALVKRYPDLPVVIAESDPGWAREVFSHRDLVALLSLPQVILIVGPDPTAVGSFFDGVACRTVVTLPWRPLETLDPQWSRSLADQVAQAQARGRVNLATLERFGDLWARNLGRNQVYAPRVRPVEALRGTGRGRPAVIAAAGPSLTDALGWLAAHRARFLFIAVDTAWPTLSSHGLVPDLLVVLDGQYWNSRHVDHPVPDTTLVVTEWVGPPRAFRLAPDRTFVAASSVSFLRRREAQVWGDLGTLPSGGSVATAAWSLALLLGCSEIAFAGLDLGYPKGQTHAAGSQFEEAVHRRSRRLAPAETLGLGLRDPHLVGRPAVNGGLVLSDRRMDLYRDWLSASAAAHPEVRAVNLSRRGSLVPGLDSPSSDYGDRWPVLKPWSPPAAAPLVRRPVPFVPIPSLGNDPELAYSVARSIWGADVWDRWADRAWQTWTRFPSARSRRSLEEVLGWAARWAEMFKDL